ncbi:MAG: squalene/phytoene synthase family protein [Haloarculaceae archaeon]
MSEAPGVTRDRAWTFDAVESVSRTFALSIDLLEEPVSSWVCTGYLLCRIADTVEDDPTIQPRVRADLLDTYDAVLDPGNETDVPAFLEAVEPVRPADGGADWAVVDEADRVFRVFESFPPEVAGAIRPVVREMAGGMAGFLRRYAEEGGLRLRTLDELEEYCWYVAGTVGELFTNLLGCYGTDGPTPDPGDARSFALLLQLVNIAKDVRADYETENNVYLPAEWLAEEGVSHAAIGDPERTEGVARVVRRLTDHAAEYAPGARRYLECLPEGQAMLLEAMGMPYLLALGTVRELRGRSRAAVERTRTVKLGREEVEALLAEAEDGLTQAELTRLAEHVRAGPYHRSNASI